MPLVAYNQLMRPLKLHVKTTLLAAALIDRIGSGPVIALGGAALMVVGYMFAQALRQRQILHRSAN